MDVKPISKYPQATKQLDGVPRNVKPLNKTESEIEHVGWEIVNYAEVCAPAIAFSEASRDLRNFSDSILNGGRLHKPYLDRMVEMSLPLITS